MKQLENIKLRFKNNGKVVENYFFMTALQIISSAFGVLIYPYLIYRDWETDRKSTRLNSSHITRSRMPSSA